MIKPAKISEIHHIIAITKACAKDMISKGIYQWNEHYPTPNAFEKDITRNELYILEKNDAIVGCIVISTFMDKEYEDIAWRTVNENNLYIHRLAIHPEHQGKGYAQELLSYAENYGDTNGFASIRLDTFSQNKRNQKFYETRGYHKLGDIFFPKQSEHPFHCYELVL